MADVDGDANTSEPLDLYYHHNSLGSVVAVTDAAGTVVESYRYSAYGTPTIYDKNGSQVSTTQVQQPFMFTGRRWDFEEGSGLYYYRLRYYDPAAGRFVSRDPLGLWGDPSQSGNGQSYCGNNPVNLVDPLGLREMGSAAELLPDLIADLQNLGMPTQWLTDLMNAAPDLEIHTTDGGPQFDHWGKVPGAWDDKLKIPDRGFTGRDGKWVFKDLLDIAAGGGRWAPDAELAASIIEELFHAWMRLVKGGCEAQGFGEGEEEVMSDYIHRLVREYLGLKVDYQAGRITRRETEERWDNPTGEWTKPVTAPPGEPQTKQEKTAVRAAFEDADGQRTINGRPATDFRMDEAKRDWLKSQGLDFEVGPS